MQAGPATWRWSRYGVALVLALAVTSVVHGWWKLLPLGTTVVLVTRVAPWIARRTDDT